MTHRSKMAQTSRLSGLSSYLSNISISAVLALWSTNSWGKCLVVPPWPHTCLTISVSRWFTFIHRCLKTRLSLCSCVEFQHRFNFNARIEAGRVGQLYCICCQLNITSGVQNVPHYGQIFWFKFNPHSNTPWHQVRLPRWRQSLC